MRGIREMQSLAIHRMIASRMLDDPDAVLGKALSNLMRWMENRNDPEVPAVMKEWESMLKNRSYGEIASFIVSDSEQADRMRQSSPFAGVPAPKEVWAIKRNHEAA